MQNVPAFIGAIVVLVALVAPLAVSTTTDPRAGGSGGIADFAIRGNAGVKNMTKEGIAGTVTSVNCIRKAGTSWVCNVQASDGSGSAIPVVVAADGQSWTSE